MARLPRFVIPGHPQHVIVRGNNRAEIFCVEADYRFYLEKLKAACGNTDNWGQTPIRMIESLRKKLKVMTVFQRDECRDIKSIGSNFAAF